MHPYMQDDLPGQRERQLRRSGETPAHPAARFERDALPGSLIQFPAAANLSGRFEAVYRPELVDGPVVFTDYVLVADNRRP